MPTYSAPRSHNLAAYSADLITPTGQKVLQVLGDSINNPASATSLFRSRLALPFKWNGYYQSMFGSVLLGYAGSNSSNRTVNSNVTPAGSAGSITGSSAIWPVYWNESQWSANPSGNHYGDNFAYLKAPSTNIPSIEHLAPHLPRPFLRDETYAVTARAILYTVARSIAANLTPSGSRQGTDTPSLSTVATGSAVVKGSNGTYQYGEASCGAVSIDGNSNGTYDNAFPGFRWTSAAGAINAGVTDSLIQLGTRFLSADPNGVMYNAPFSIGGWSLADMANTALVTDAALTAYYTLVGVPTHMWLHAGQNPVAGDYTNLDGGSRTSFKANVNAVIDRHNAIIAAINGSTPRWCMVAQYATSSAIGVSNSFNFHDQMSLAHYEIAQSRGSLYSTLNLFQCAHGMDLQRELGKGQNFIWAGGTDLIHPERYGAEYFSQAEAREIIRAVAYEEGMSVGATGYRDIRGKR